MKTVLIIGNTYPVKEQLKAMGGRWNAAAKGWDVPEEQAEAAAKLVAEAPKAAYVPGQAKARPRYARCAECGAPSKGYYRCYQCSLDYRDGGGMYAGGQSYRDKNGNFVLGDED